MSGPEDRSGKTEEMLRRAVEIARSGKVTAIVVPWRAGMTGRESAKFVVDRVEREGLTCRLSAPNDVTVVVTIEPKRGQP